MSRASVYKVLETTGIPVVHMAWPVGSAPALPWIAYRLDEDRKLNADNMRWETHAIWCAELYQSEADTELEVTVERVISDAFGDYDKEEVWVESEGCLMTSYTFTEIERIDSNG